MATECHVQFRRKRDVQFRRKALDFERFTHSESLDLRDTRRQSYFLYFRSMQETARKKREKKTNGKEDQHDTS